VRTVTEVLTQVPAEISRCVGLIRPEEVEQAASEILAAKRVFAAGAGRSALGIRGFAMRLMHTGKPAYVIGETVTPGAEPGDLLVIGSGSGRTGSLVAMSQKAKEVGMRVLLLTIDPESPIAELADAVVRIPAPSPKTAAGVPQSDSIQPMGSLFEQSLFVVLDCIVLILMQKQGLTSDVMFGRHANLE